MTADRHEFRITCPHCGAATLQRLSFCVGCRASLLPANDLGAVNAPVSGDSESPAVPPAAPPPTPASPRYTLASLALWMVLISVFLAVAVRSPGYGVAFLFLCLPALTRTIQVNGLRKAAGQPMSMREKTLEFLYSFAVVLAVTGVSGGIIYGGVVVSVAGAGRGGLDSGGIFGMLCTLTCAGVIGLLLLVRFWPPRTK
jgi:hypothetical protein